MTNKAKRVLDSMTQVLGAPPAALLPAEPGWRAVFLTGPADEPQIQVEAIYQWEVMGFLAPEPPLSVERMATYAKVSQAIQTMAKDPMAIPDIPDGTAELSTSQGEARRLGLPSLMPVTNSGALRKVALSVIGCLDPSDKREDSQVVAEITALAEELAKRG